MSAPARPRPLVAVVFRVPLFVEAVAAAFDGIAEVQGLRAADSALDGLLIALRPNAVIVEGPEEPWFAVEVPLTRRAPQLYALDGTPVIDIKPYFPSVDALADALMPDRGER